MPKPNKIWCHNCCHDSGEYQKPCKRIMELIKKYGSLKESDYCNPNVDNRYWFWDGSTEEK